MFNAAASHMSFLCRFVCCCDFTTLSALFVGDWNAAAAHLGRSATAIISQYGGDSIELGQQLFKLAQLHFNG